MAATKRSGVRTTTFANVVTVSESAFLKALASQVKSLGLTMAEFRRQGSTGEFVDDRVRDLWDMAGLEV